MSNRLIAIALASLSATAWPASAAERTPVVFVPGFLGSTLADDRGPLWGAPYTIISRASDLEFTGKERYGVVRATGLVTGGQLFGSLQATGYRPIMRLFRKLGFKLNKDVFLFAYDWRRSNFDGARQLAELVERTPQLRNRKFNLVSHSMGGLVSSIYMARHDGASRVKHFVTLGTPHLGSAKMLGNMLGQYDKETKLMQLLIGKDTFRRVLLSFPSIYEMLPQGEGTCLIATGTRATPKACRVLEKAFWTKIGHVDGIRQFLPDRLSGYLAQSRQIKKFACGKFSGDVRVFRIAGAGIRTPGQIILIGRNRSPAMPKFVRGDGAVTEYSASCGDLAGTEIVLAGHLGMLANSIVQRRLANILLQGFRADPFDAGRNYRVAWPDIRTAPGVSRQAPPVISIGLDARYLRRGDRLKVEIRLGTADGAPLRDEVVAAAVIPTDADLPTHEFAAVERAPGSYVVSLPVYQTPGLYRVRVRVPNAGQVETYFAVLASGAPESAETSGTEGVIRSQAAELMDQLKSALGEPGGRSRGGRVRAAVRLFDNADIPLSPGRATVIDGQFLRALRRGAPESLSFQPAKKSPEAEIVIVGRMGLVDGDIYVSYKAVRLAGDAAGAVVAATTPARLPIDPVAPAHTLTSAIENAAATLSKAVTRLAELRLGGVRFERSGVQTPFGTHVEAAIAERLKRRSPADAGDGPGTYRLSGRYWDFDDAIELRLWLTGRDGRTASWAGRLKRDSVPPGLAIRAPMRIDRWRDNDNLGPIGLSLTSARGRDPVYRLGDTLDLNLRVDRDSWVYCFYRQTDGRMFKLLPNKYRKQAFLVAGRTYRFPAEIPVDVTFVAPAGIEFVKCFATGRDVAPELPAVLRRLDFAPLPPGTEARLAHRFRRIPNSALTEASMVVTVRR